VNPEKRTKLGERVIAAAEAALAAPSCVSFIDVLVGIGWLDGGAVERWRQGRVDYLERAIQTGPPRISAAMDQFRSWATAKGLLPSETAYVARTPQRPALRFSESGKPAIERLYRTHWISRELPASKRERLTEKVIRPLIAAWTCHRCGRSGDLLMMEEPGPACLQCAGLGDLEFLPAGDALLTRRAKGKSARNAVVVRFSRTRNCYERQGLLIEPHALAQAEQEIAAQQRRR
jgi:hypothetical protein